MSLTESVEMYLETIYFIQQDHGHAHVVDIADRMGVSKPSVTKAMNQLKEEGFVNKESYGHITLTKRGVEISELVAKRHKAITVYLERTLKLTSEEASENACRMEHIVSTGMMDAIERFLESDQGSTLRSE
ncbi:metal-dependent transcriptional regulator [Alkalibacter rhizosphaerae]|uniref:Metal-dependent transcriptional regulator n=1 Tax=Alkalibacter rhizosphaerae TaxID=2815577 RepID=A0A974XE95_9FIRM|nr:metal-dependent transcriptional regulator [Alkalibacter rhizosphaerae]QSX08252.1 metal-dependent transcriptional regulator [Alkalibacter rhizosphaerae]